MRIQHNIAALNSYRNLRVNNDALSKNLEKLSSGYKINRAGDDAAGLAISEKMRAQITGLETAQKNANDGISLVQTAEGAMTEVHSMLNRMVELATQSANGTYADDVDRENLQKELTALQDEIDRIADSTNYNGINLLDGSLASKGGTKSVTINGVASAKSSGIKGAYEASTGYKLGAADTTTFKDDDTIEYTVSLSDGTSYTTKLKLDGDSLVAGDGTKYVYDDTDDTSAYTSVDNAIKSELGKTELAKMYNISITSPGDGSAGATVKLEALEEGTDTPRVSAFDVRVTNSGTLLQDSSINTVELGIKETEPLDEGREIDASRITLYDGTNYDDAVFEINGHKFVVMTGDMTNAETDDAGAALTASGAPIAAMNTTYGLGSDVTILISDSNSVDQSVGTPHNGLYADDANFAQNIKKIADVTGLKVTDAIANDGNNVAAGAGIRLSRGDAAIGGLVLQIGDTADEFNKMRVSVGDMHAKAMGIGGIDISTQAGAQSAINKIKAAINYVSSSRGDLGAVQNRLEHTINNLSVATENMTAAESRIRDVDMAEEMMAYTKNNILVQASQAMLAQANQIPQGVLQLLQ